MAKALPIPQLKSDSPVSACLPVIVETRINEIALFKPGVLQGLAEAVHDMRVACRRLQTALAVFSDSIGKGKLAPFKKQLRRLTRRLGKIRQIDMLMEILSARIHAADDKERTVRNMLFARYATSRKEAQLKTVKFLAEIEDAKLFGRFIASMKTSYAGGEQKVRRAAGKNIFAETMRDSLGDLVGDFSSAVAAVHRHGNSMEVLHKMRISGKPLRYAMELAEPFFSGGFKDYFQEVKKMIELIGDIHDIDVASVSLNSFCKELQSYNDVAGRLIDRFPIGFLIEAHDELETSRNTLLAGVQKILHEWRQDRLFRMLLAMLSNP